MYLVFALLAPIAMFGLLPGLAWFEERMLGPATTRKKPDATPDAEPDGAEVTPLRPTPIPFRPARSSAVAPQITPLAAVPDPAPRHSGRTPVRHSTDRASQHHRHTLKRRRGLRAA
ncbi:hypothetical protein LO772_19580 [Yinghuangia sp. ASG 101]|uniref:hypothetical protein n=1 Tax=Yinghuangia sp. ASG 101 TaxID=2896848 RepID=UPI001E5E9204|nr:hypothetical protein [Yinghuangia sp. ASG 101]UGQ09159.1 hypothetical protein LO772_19580 [Yinghuangia sp. ASG 101]